MTSQRIKERRKVGGSGALVSVFGISVTFQNNSLSWVAAVQNATCWFVGSGGPDANRGSLQRLEDKDLTQRTQRLERGGRGERQGRFIVHEARDGAEVLAKAAPFGAQGKRNDVVGLGAVEKG
jgi:hypothetical protein